MMLSSNTSRTFFRARTATTGWGGCPLVFVGSELARADTGTRQAASQGFRELVDVIAKVSRHKNASAARSEAIFTLAAMIGAVSLSRIVDDPELSALILDETRTHLTKVREKKAPKTRRAAGRSAPE
jgi:TetR/AcrR family transcriptional repressor of nem operon